MADQSTGIAGIAKFVCGILGFVLFMWIPKTGKGFLLYGILVVLLILLFIFVFPDRPEDENETRHPLF